MRRNAGFTLIGLGIALAGLASVPLSLKVVPMAWAFFVGGILVLLVGGTLAALGETKPERQARAHDLLVKRHALENERDELNARRIEIEGTEGVKEYHATVAESYDDNLRSGVIAGELAVLTAERDKIDRRLSQIQAELESLDRLG